MKIAGVEVGEKGARKMGVVVKSVITLGSVYVAMFGGGAPGGRLLAPAGSPFCSGAALSSAAPVQLASAAACAERLSAQARDTVRNFALSKPAAIAKPATRSVDTLTRADFDVPWTGPRSSSARKDKRKPG